MTIFYEKHRVFILRNWGNVKEKNFQVSPPICGANQWPSFYMITASVMKGLMLLIYSNFPAEYMVHSIDGIFSKKCMI